MRQSVVTRVRAVVSSDRGVVPDPHHDAGTEGHPGAEVVEQRALAHLTDGAVGRERPPGAIQKPPAMPCGR